MFYIILTIIFNVILAVVFRFYKEFDVQNLPAIVVNYFVCATIASLVAGTTPLDSYVDRPEWLLQANLIGFLFIGGFMVVAYTIQFYGVGVTAVFQKVSLVVTALFAIFYFSEALSVLKLIGIPLALFSIILIQGGGTKLIKTIPSKQWWIALLPLLTFSFNGIIDTLLFFVERTGIVQGGDFAFIAFIFSVAGLAGLFYFLIQVIRNKARFTWKDVVGGIALGVPNFFSIHFFLLALGTGLGGSVVVPLNNVGIILLSAVVGYLIFQELFTTRKTVGLVAAILAILFLSLS